MLKMLQLFREVIDGNIHHPDYKHVTEYAALLRQLITGKDAEKLLLRYTPNEDEESFEIRQQITVYMTKTICHGLKNPFHRLARLNNIRKEIGNPGSNENRKVEEVLEHIEKFHGHKSLSDYLAGRVTNLIFSDPNAFMVLDFDPFDSDFEKPSPYPFIIPSGNAMNFGYKNEILQWLIEKSLITYKDSKGKDQPGKKFRMFLKNNILEYTQIEKREGEFTMREGVVVNSLGQLEYNDLIPDSIWKSKDGNYYQLKVYQPKTGRVQAARVGYIPDEETNERTMVSPLDPAIPLLLKSIRTVSEMDLAVTLHIHPERIQRLQECPGEVKAGLKMGCTNGINKEGDTCPLCKGTSLLPPNTSGASYTGAPMPSNEDIKTYGYLPLSEIATYLRIPVEGLQFLDGYIDKLGHKSYEALFNNDVTQQQRINVTATAVMENKDGMYNALTPYAHQISFLWEYFAELISIVTDNGQMKASYNFPSDFKLMTLGELYAQLAAAKEAGANDFDLQELNRKIAELRSEGDPAKFKRYLVKEKFMPFLGKTSDEVKMIISTGRARPEDEVLWTHSDSILDDIENEQGEKFYDMPYKQQWELIKDKINQIIPDLRINQASTTRFTVPVPDTEGNPDGGGGEIVTGAEAEEVEEAEEVV